MPTDSLNLPNLVSCPFGNLIDRRGERGARYADPRHTMWWKWAIVVIREWIWYKQPAAAAAPDNNASILHQTATGCSVGSLPPPPKIGSSTFRGITNNWRRISFCAHSLPTNEMSPTHLHRIVCCVVILIRPDNVPNLSPAATLRCALVPGRLTFRPREWYNTSVALLCDLHSLLPKKTKNLLGGVMYALLIARTHRELFISSVTVQWRVGDLRDDAHESNLNTERYLEGRLKL